MPLVQIVLTLQKQIEALRRENQELSMVQDYYLANRLIKQQVVYSVQVKSLRIQI